MIMQYGHILIYGKIGLTMILKIHLFIQAQVHLAISLLSLRKTKSNSTVGRIVLEDQRKNHQEMARKDLPHFSPEWQRELQKTFRKELRKSITILRKEDPQ